MGKKKLRSKYTSKGERRSIAKKNTTKRSDLDKMHDKFDAFLAGKKVYFTVPNSDPKNTKERFVRVEGKELYGDYRKCNERAILK